MSAEGRRRDWSLLPLDLLRSVSETLTDISDIALFRSVCTKWRTAAGPLPPHPRHLPYLLLIPYIYDDPSLRVDPHVITPLDPRRQIYSLKTPFSLRMDANSSIYGSSFGLFLVVSEDNKYISIVDPLPGGRWSNRLPKLPDKGDNSWGCERAKILSVDPKLVVLIITNGAVFVWQDGDNHWEYVWGDEEFDKLVDAMDVAFYKGKFYIVGDDDNTHVVEHTYGVEPDYTCIASQQFSCPKIVDSCSDSSVYLFESSSGDLLMVVSDISEDCPVKSVFRLVGNKWKKTTSIGNDTLFLDHDNLTCFPSGRFGGYKSNFLSRPLLRRNACLRYWEGCNCRDS